MKFNEIIRQKRQALGLTQEHIATILGVSTPAVSKWESGLSYPDITLLPSLARVLHTDLNTLLSFKEDLDKREVALFMNEVSTCFEENGFEAGYHLAIEKIEEYPNSDLLILNMATLLEGGLALYGKKLDTATYESMIESMYQKVANESTDVSLQEQALSQFIQQLIKKKDYDRAEKLLEKMTADRYFDKNQIQIDLYLKQQKLDQAVKLAEETLLSKTNDIHAYLMVLMEIAIKQERIEDAKAIAMVDKEAAKLFDLWEYNQYVSEFQLQSALGNKLEVLKVLKKMFKVLTKKWDINASPLYRHIKTKPVDENLGLMFQKNIKESMDALEKDVHA